MSLRESQTGVVDFNSPLIRREWMKEGMIQAASKSFWAPMTGMSKDSVIYMKRDVRAGRGETVTFDFNGNQASEGFLGKERAAGKGSQKKKFSSQLGIKRARWVTDNGDEFDTDEIDSMDLSNHSESRTRLSDLWVRAKDQSIFDAAQGFLNGIDNSHIIRPNDRATIGDLTSNDTMSYDFLLEIEEMLKSGESTVGDRRRPLMADYSMGMMPHWKLVITNRQRIQLMQDTRFTNIMSQGDMRGNGNRMISGYMGMVGSLMIMEAPYFFGTSSSNRLTKTSVEISGLRQKDESGNYTGQSGFGATSGDIIADRAFLLGASAFQFGMGRDADYKFKSSEDFDITSESALEVWYNVQKTQLISEDEDYEVAKVGGFDWGIIAVDTYARQVA